ncbi:hypothetical protein GCM10010232_59420 [Streptomyces amakusaensis]
MSGTRRGRGGGWVPVPPPTVRPVSGPEPPPGPEPEPQAAEGCWNCRGRLPEGHYPCPSCGSGRARLLLVCADPALEIAHGPGGPLRLGRDPEWAPRTAAVFSCLLTLSRRHATVTLDEDGRAWVEEAAPGSRNHTYVNGARIVPGTRTPLRDGDELRLGLRVVAFSVTLYGEGVP